MAMSASATLWFAVDSLNSTDLFRSLCCTIEAYNVTCCLYFIELPIKIMENYSEKLVNCCFCDKDLSPGGQNSIVSSTKYKCPSCERVYCSANCFVGHKTKFDCSGVRNRTPYVDLSKFDQKQFLDDYFFLEEVNNKIETAHRSLPSSSSLKLNDAIKKRKPRRRNWKPKNKKGNPAQQSLDDHQQNPQQR